APPHHGVGCPHRAEGVALTEPRALSSRPRAPRAAPGSATVTRGVVRSVTIQQEGGARVGIPDRVIEVLSGPSFVQIGTRDETLRPAHTYAVGATVHEDRQTVTVLVPTARAARILPHLESNGRVALGMGLFSHEAYQLKGTYLGTRPTNADDLARQEAYRRALLADALRAGYPEEIARP